MVPPSRPLPPGLQLLWARGAHHAPQPRGPPPRAFALTSACCEACARAARSGSQDDTTRAPRRTTAPSPGEPLVSPRASSDRACARIHSLAEAARTGMRGPRGGLRGAASDRTAPSAAGGKPPPADGKKLARRPNKLPQRPHGPAPPPVRATKGGARLRGPIEREPRHTWPGTHSTSAPLPRHVRPTQHVSTPRGGFLEKLRIPEFANLKSLYSLRPHTPKCQKQRF